MIKQEFFPMHTLAHEGNGYPWIILTRDSKNIYNSNYIYQYIRLPVSVKASQSNKKFIKQTSYKPHEHLIK